jgi:hypothetical protein
MLHEKLEEKASKEDEDDQLLTSSGEAHRCH